MDSIFNPSTQEAEAGGPLEVNLVYRASFKDSQGYTKKPCLKQNKTNSNGLSRCFCNLRHRLLFLRTKVGLPAPT